MPWTRNTPQAGGTVRIGRSSVQELPAHSLTVMRVTSAASAAGAAGAGGAGGAGGARGGK
jgi:hypothetical protein